MVVTPHTRMMMQQPYQPQQYDVLLTDTPSPLK